MKKQALKEMHKVIMTGTGSKVYCKRLRNNSKILFQMASYLWLAASASDGFVGFGFRSTLGR